MYVPKLFGDASPRDIKAIVEQYSFATLITHLDDAIELSHLPLALEGTLAGGTLETFDVRLSLPFAYFWGLPSSVEPANSFRPSASLTFRALARLEPSFAI